MEKIITEPYLLEIMIKKYNILYDNYDLISNLEEPIKKDFVFLIVNCYPRCHKKSGKIKKLINYKKVN